LEFHFHLYIEINQAEDEAAALEAKGGVKVKRENKMFPDESYIPKDRMFAVVI
jgi:predicted enzyme related to lactoylglutathione lyase